MSVGGGASRRARGAAPEGRVPSGMVGDGVRFVTGAPAGATGVVVGACGGGNAVVSGTAGFASLPEGCCAPCVARVARCELSSSGHAIRAATTAAAASAATCQRGSLARLATLNGCAVSAGPVGVDTSAARACCAAIWRACSRIAARTCAGGRSPLVSSTARIRASTAVSESGVGSVMSPPIAGHAASRARSAADSWSSRKSSPSVQRSPPVRARRQDAAGKPCAARRAAGSAPARR